jgi:hypothetical protein
MGEKTFSHRTPTVSSFSLGERRRDVYAEEERGDIPHPMSSAITQMMFGLRGASPVAASAVPTTPTVIEAITDNRRNCETFVIFGEPQISFSHVPSIT